MNGLTSPDLRQIPAWSDAVGPGWATLLHQLHHDLLSLDAAYRVESFCTKFGGLRITVSDRFDAAGDFDGEFADRAAALADAAEYASERTCELCGAPGRIRLRGTGPDIRMVACCEECRIGSAHPGARPRHQPDNSITQG